MVENPKNPFIDLTQEDKVVLDKCVLNYIMFYHSIMIKYPNPKQYVKEVSKLLGSDKENLKFFSLMSIRDNPASNKPFKPRDLKKKLSDKLTNPLNELSDEITTQMNSMSNSLTSR